MYSYLKLWCAGYCKGTGDIEQPPCIPVISVHLPSSSFPVSTGHCFRLRRIVSLKTTSHNESHKFSLSQRQGRHHGFLSGWTNRRQVTNLPPNTIKIGKCTVLGHFILESGWTSPPEFFTGGDASPPSPRFRRSCSKMLSSTVAVDFLQFFWFLRAA